MAWCCMEICVLGSHARSGACNSQSVNADITQNSRHLHHIIHFYRCYFYICIGIMGVLQSLIIHRFLDHTPKYFCGFSYKLYLAVLGSAYGMVRDDAHPCCVSLLHSFVYQKVQAHVYTLALDRKISSLSGGRAVCHYIYVGRNCPVYLLPILNFDCSLHTFLRPLSGNSFGDTCGWPFFYPF